MGQCPPASSKPAASPVANAKQPNSSKKKNKGGNKNAVTQAVPSGSPQSDDDNVNNNLIHNINDDNINSGIYDADNFDEKEMDEMFLKYNSRIDHFEKVILESALPVDTNRITLFPRNQVYNHMNNTYPLLHGSMLLLIHHFLLIKSSYGSPIEKELYSNMSISSFINRLSTKRCVVFFQSYDSYLLRNGYNASGEWEHIGTQKELDILSNNDITPHKKPRLKDYLSYDELLINAMCGISSPTHFINNGNRNNCGRVVPNNKTYPKYGIYTGLVGARFEKEQVMEYALMEINNNQNVANNGYGTYDDNKSDFNENNCDIDKELDDNLFMKRVDLSLSNDKDNNKVIWRAFERFYSRNCFPNYDDVRSKYDATSDVDADDGKNDNNGHGDDKISNRYYEKQGWGQFNTFLDREIFKQRIRVSMELFLFDADKRAKDRMDRLNDIDDADGVMYGAYCHVVGLGTGVWSFKKSEQDRMIVQVTKDIIETSDLKYISCVYFAWMHDECMNKSDDDNTIIFQKENDLKVVNTKIKIKKKKKNKKKNKDKKQNDTYYFVHDFTKKHKVYISAGKRNPADVLMAPFNKCLTVAMYAWDSNAFPGNEYYQGMLSASGDPAAASCSTISFIQNSEINQENINGENTGIFFFDEITGKYEFCKLKDMDLNDPIKKKEWLRKSVLSIPYKRTKFISNDNNPTDDNDDDDEQP